MRGKSRARVEPHGGFRSHLGSGLASQIGCKRKKQPLTDGFSLESAAGERLKELCCSQVGEGQQRKAFATSTMRKGQLPRSHPAPQTLRFRWNGATLEEQRPEGDDTQRGGFRQPPCCGTNRVGCSLGQVQSPQNSFICFSKGETAALGESSQRFLI